jgi:hypothetical protein
MLSALWPGEVTSWGTARAELPIGGTMRTGRWLLAVSTAVPLALGAAATGAGAAAPRTSHLAPRAALTTDENASLAATADSDGDRFVFWKGEDGNLWYTVYTSGSTSWSTATVVAGMGPLGSQPTVAIYDGHDDYEVLGPDASLRPELSTSARPEDDGTSYLWVMWKGVDGNLWSVTGTIANIVTAPSTIIWASTPSVVPGMGPLGSAPTATYVHLEEVGHLYVFWKGTDGNLWSVTGTLSDGSLTWPSTPSVVPGMGPLGSAPAAGSDYYGDVYVYWQGSGNNTHLWETWYNNQADTPAWTTAPIDLGQISGNMGSAPSVTVSGYGQQFVFWQGLDGNLYFAEWGGEVAGPDEDLPYMAGWLNGGFNYVGEGPMDSAPAATVTLGAEVSGVLDVFWKGTNLNIWMASSSTSPVSWSGPASVGDGPLDGM